MFFHMLKQTSGVFVSVFYGKAKPFHADFQVSGNTDAEAVDLAQLVFDIGVTLLSGQFQISDGFLRIGFQIQHAHPINRIHISEDGGFVEIRLRMLQVFLSSNTLEIWKLNL